MRLKRLLNTTGGDILETYFTQILLFILGMAISIITARLLGPEGKGIFRIAYTLSSQGAQIVSLGIGVSIVYYVAKRFVPPASIVTAALFLSITLGSIVTIGLVIASPVLARWFMSGRHIEINSILIAAPLSVILLMESFLTLIYRGDNRFHQFNFFMLLKRGLVLSLVILLLLALRMGVIGVLSAHIIATIICLCILVGSIKRDFGISFSLDMRVVKNLATFNWTGHVGMLFQLLTYRLDIFIIAIFLPTSHVGLYSVATSAAELMWYLPNAIGRVLLARTPASHTQLANKRIVMSCQLLLILMILQGLVFMLFAPWLFPLAFGAAFAYASYPFAFLIPGIVTLSIWKILVNEATARGKPWCKLYSSVVGGIASVILDLILVPIMGIIGAAIASSIAYTIAAGTMLILFHKETGVAIPALLIPRKSTLSEGFKTITDALKRA